MNSKSLWTVMIFCMLALPVMIFAGDNPAELTPRQLNLIEKNILYNLENSCSYVYVSTVQTLIDLKDNYPSLNFDYAIIPLMSKLKNDDCTPSRIISALALSHFKSPMARYAIQRRALYDSSERVTKVCSAIVHSWSDKGQTENPLANNLE